MSNNTYKTLALLLIIIVGLTILLFLPQDKKVYTLKTYDKDTKVTDISEFVIRNGDTIFHGKFTKYNDNGKKIAEGNFVNGHIKGKSIYFYENGNIESIQYKNGKTIYESIWNYPNGNIERYIIYDEFKNPVFIIRYDEQGNVKSYEGLPLIEIYQFKIANKEKFKIKTNQILKVGDILKYEYLLADLPKAKRDFKIESLGLDNSKINRKIIKRPHRGIDVEEVLIKKGTNTIRAIVKYQFNDTKKTIINDTISFDVEVN